MGHVWHALRACVVNSNGTTDPQLDLWADSTHPPTRPSVLLCIGKQDWCMQRLMSTHCTEHTCDSRSPCADLSLRCCFFSFPLVHSQSAVRRKHLLCTQGDNCSLHHSVVADCYHVFTWRVLFCQPSSATSRLLCRSTTCLLQVNYLLKVEVSASWDGLV